MNKQIKKYQNEGYLIYNFFKKKDYELIHKFAITWFYKV